MALKLREIRLAPMNSLKFQAATLPMISLEEIIKSTSHPLFKERDQVQCFSGTTVRLLASPLVPQKQITRSKETF